MGIHGIIEFGNRLMTGVVGIIALVAVRAGVAPPRERRDLCDAFALSRRRAA